MTKKEWAESEIKAMEENIEDLKEARGEAWSNGDRASYDEISRQIRELNLTIENLRTSYIEEN